MLGNLFSFGGKSDGEKYLYKELGRSDKNQNQLIRAVPALSSKLYETARAIADQNLHQLVQDYSEKTGRGDFFLELDPDRLKKIELEIINFMLYFIGARYHELLKDDSKVLAFLHAIYLGLQKIFFIPEENFQRYTKLLVKETDIQDIYKKFTISLAGLVTGRPDIALATEINNLCPTIEKASRLMVDVTARTTR